MQGSDAVDIAWVCYVKALSISCDHRHFSCICAVEHVDQCGIPVFCTSMMTIELQLVSLIVVMSLDHMSGEVHIFCVLMPYVLHQYSWRFRQLCCFGNKLIQVSVQLLVPFFPEVVLVVDDYSKSSRVSCLFNQLFYSRNKLQITV